MEVLTLILCSIICYFFFLHGLNLYRRKRLPPGPVGLPIIGNLLDIGSKPHESLAKLANKYGSLMTIRLGSITSVVASTPDVAREVLQRNDEVCAGRVVPDVISAYKHPEAAVLWMSPNDTWRTIRKALNMYLTNQNKLDSLNELRENVVEGMLEFLRESGRKKVAVDIGKLAFAVALNQISNTFFSQDVASYDDSNELEGFKMAVETAMEVQGKFNIADMFPVLKPLDPQNLRAQAKKAFDWLDRVIEGFVNERLKHRGSKLPTFGDLLDSLLDYSRDTDVTFNLIHIKALFVDLFMAGTDTVSTTITWAMSELLLNPDMLLRVRQEVCQVLGEGEKVKESKVLDLPYLQAVIKETMRLHLAAPLLPHKTMMEVKIGNYIIPTNTQILVNSWAMARDPRYWEKPMEFFPDRFLRNKLDFKGQHFEFIPFGSGRRRCPALPLAHRMVSLIISSFVYHFDWKLPYPKEEMDMNDVCGLTLVKATPLVATPIPFKRLD